MTPTATATLSPAGPATDTPADARLEDLLVEDVLVEEVSIDGMCGVY